MPEALLPAQPRPWICRRMRLGGWSTSIAGIAPIVKTLYEEVLVPWKERCGAHLQVERFDISSDVGYEVFVATEEALIGEAGRWDLPVVVAGDKVYVGARAIREDFTSFLPCSAGIGRECVAGGARAPSGGGLRGCGG